MYQAQFKNGMDVLPWMTQQEDAVMKVFDAVGTSPGFNGDTQKALSSIKAKTLILAGTKDLLIQNSRHRPSRMCA
jgi:homoserine O-acetyltransferase/O-succinyltransferase